MLVHHSDAGGHRVARTLEVLLDIVEQNCSFFGLV